MDAERAHELLKSIALDQPETFYGSHEGLALGVGLIVDGVEFPIFDPSANRFAVKEGLVYVLSHECDLDATNERLLNDMALICPVLDIGNLLIEATQHGLEDHFMGAFLGNLATRKVSRAVYMPPIAEHLPLGGLLYFNKIVSTSVARLQDGNRICAVTAFGLTTIDMAIENHLRRPKAEHLPLERATVRRGSSRVGVSREND